MGYRIKLLGVSQMTENGLEQRMTPCLVPETSPLGQLERHNMVVVEGDEVGQIVLRGAGAGEGPTASAVCRCVGFGPWNSYSNLWSTCGNTWNRNSGAV